MRYFHKFQFNYYFEIVRWKHGGDINLFCNTDSRGECFHLRKQSQIVTLLEVDYVTLSVTVASFPSRSCE